MNPLAQAAQDWLRAVQVSDSLPLAQRLELLIHALLTLYATALATEAAPWVGSPPPLPELELPPVDLGVLDTWHGLPDPHTLAVVEPRSLSADLASISQEIARGQALWSADDQEHALSWWRHGLHTSWGAVAVDCLAVLHRGLVRFRPEAPPQRTGPALAEELVLLEPRPEPRTAGMGLRLEAAVVGQEVVAVHPQGPSADLLQPGDLLLSVDGLPLDGLEPHQAGVLLAGPVGVPRQVEIYRDGESLILEIVPRPLPQQSPDQS